MSEGLSLELPDEDLWQIFLRALAGQGESFGSQVDGPFLISTLSGVHDDISTSQQNFLARMMLNRVSDQLKNGLPLGIVEQNILRLSFPYFTRSDVLSEVRLVLRSHFLPESWSKLSTDDLRVLADSLIDIGIEESTSGGWTAYYEHAVGRVGLEEAAFYQTGTALISIGIDDFFSFIERAGDPSRIQSAIAAYLPSLLSKYGKTLVLTHLSTFLHKHPDQQGLRRAASSAGLEISGIDPNLKSGMGDSPVERELCWAFDLLKLEMQREQRSLIQQVIQSDPIKVIYSDYEGDSALTKFQQGLLTEIEQLAGKTTKVVPTPTSTFSEVPPEISGLQRLVFLFPMYLTGFKRDKAGYGVIPYGQQQRIGALVPERNPLQRLEEDEVSLEYILTEAAHSKMPIYYLRNYAMAEMVIQCVDSTPKLRSVFEKRQLFALESKSRNVAALSQQLIRLKETNWVYLFDLGDKDVIDLVQDRVGKSKVFSVTHDLLIPVGVGFNRYMVPWMIENQRWKRLESSALKLLGDFDLSNHLRELGIDPDSRLLSARELHKDIIKLDSRRKVKN